LALKGLAERWPASGPETAPRTSHTVTVRVTDQAGRPIPGADVLFFVDGPPVGGTTDVNGIYSQPVYANVGVQIRLSVRAKGFALDDRWLATPYGSIEEARLVRLLSERRVVRRNRRPSTSPEQANAPIAVVANSEPQALSLPLAPAPIDSPQQSGA